MFFISMDDEALTLAMIERALRESKRVCSPRTITSEKRMVLLEAELKDGKVPLRRGGWNIMEPVSEKVVSPGEIDFVVVPGRAFDKKGNRLGRGGGYYDNFLRTLRKDIYKCAIGFECQILDEVPTDSDDYPIDALITEEKIYQF